MYAEVHHEKTCHENMHQNTGIRRVLSAVISSGA